MSASRVLLALLAVLGSAQLASAQQWHPEAILDSDNASFLDPHGQGASVYCVAIDSEGNAWVSPGSTARLHRISPSEGYEECKDSGGTPQYPTSGGPMCNDDIAFAGANNSGIDIDAEDNVFVATGTGSTMGVYAYFKGSGDYAEQAYVLSNALAGQHLASCDSLHANCVNIVRQVRVAGNRVYAAAQGSGNAFEVTLNPDHSVASIQQLFGPADAPGLTVKPTDVDVDASGNVYIAGEGGAFMIPPAGAPVELESGIDFEGVRVGQDGSVYLGASTQILEVTFDPAGQPQSTVLYASGDEEVTFGGLNNMVIDPSDVLYVVAASGGVFALDPHAPTGERTSLILGSEGHGDTPFVYGFGVAVNSTGSIVYATAGGLPAPHFLTSSAFRIRRDLDSDGVIDVLDNCVEVANGPEDPAPFCDSDGDGYGNVCDADYNQDGVVGGPDYPFFTAALGSSSGDPNYNAAVDCNCDGYVSALDYPCYVGGFESPPGPSGLSCADPEACIAGNPNCGPGSDPICDFLTAEGWER